MSANNQIIVAPVPSDLERWGVWHDGCVDNPFDFRAEPLAVFDTLEAAMARAEAECEPDEMGFLVEYGVRFISRQSVAGYEVVTWDEFPDYTYLSPVRSKRPAMQVRVVGWHLNKDAATCHCGEPASVVVVVVGDYDEFNLCSECLKKHEVASDAIDEVLRKAGF